MVSFVASIFEHLTVHQLLADGATPKQALQFLVSSQIGYPCDEPGLSVIVLVLVQDPTYQLVFLDTHGETLSSKLAAAWKDVPLPLDHL